MRNTVVSVQFLRFVAASVVVLVHLALAAEKFPEFSVTDGMRYFAGFGASGVHIFFVISGFIMVYTSFVQKDDAFSSSFFLTRRFIRIYPIYWIYCGFYVLFYSLRGGYTVPVDGVLASLALVPEYSSLIIGPGWSLSFEVYFYLCFALAMSLGLQRGLLLMTLFFLASVGLRPLIHAGHPATHVLTNSLLLEFLFGAWIGYLVVAGVKLKAMLANMLLVLAVVGFAAGYVYGYQRLPSVVMWGVPSALLIAGFVFNEKNGQVFGRVRQTAFLGDSSYSLYLLHILVVDAALLMAISGLHLVAGDAIRFGVFETIMIGIGLTVLCIAAAHLSFKAIEHRVLVSLQGAAKRRFRPVGKVRSPDAAR